MSKLANQYRIFVVDDEPIIASTLAAILKGQGFDVTSFTDPLKALEAVHSQSPDFLIADVVMPGMSGIDLAIVIRETCPTCMVLLFSGQISTTEMLEAARVRGHNFDCVAKPVPPEEILKRVCGALGIGSGNDGSKPILPS
ncbi:MAG: response regulator [Terracidiphilus sp.]|jgi:DNA-binding response OmpR family regulator